MTAPKSTKAHKEIAALVAGIIDLANTHADKESDTDGLGAMMGELCAQYPDPIRDYAKKKEVVVQFYRYLVRHTSNANFLLPVITERLIKLGKLLRRYLNLDCPVECLQYGLAFLVLVHAHTDLYQTKQVSLVDVLEKAHLFVIPTPLIIDLDKLSALLSFMVGHFLIFLRAIRYRQKFDMGSHDELWRVCHLLYVQKYPELFCTDSENLSTGMF